MKSANGTKSGSLFSGMNVAQRLIDEIETTRQEFADARASYYATAARLNELADPDDETLGRDRGGEYGDVYDEHRDAEELVNKLQLQLEALKSELLDVLDQLRIAADNENSHINLVKGCVTGSAPAPRPNARLYR
jgi:chromosome segregation ATPase